MPISRAVAALFISFFLLSFASAPALAATEEPAGETSTYASLADILEDDDARKRLISELRELSSADAETESEAHTKAEDSSFARRVAVSTQSLAENFIGEFVSGLAAVKSLFTGEQGLSMQALVSAALNLAIVVFATVVLFLLLRFLVRPVFNAADRWASQVHGEKNLLRRGCAVLGAALADVVVIALAYVGGYLLALFVVGEVGAMEPRESLFLNAFLLIEVFKSVLRALFSAKNDGLRILPMGAEQAAYWNAWLARLAGFIGYGMLVVVPLVSFSLSPALGRLAALLIMTLAFIYALAIILQNKTQVSTRLEQRARASTMAFTRILLSMLAKTWHWLAIAYFAALVIVTVTRPEDALPFMLRASLQTLLAIGGGALISVILSQLINRGFRVSEPTRRNFPMLEARLNSFLPTIMKSVRLLIVVIVAGLVLDAWAIFSLAEWLASEAGIRTVGAAISVAIILILATVLWIALASWIEMRLNPESGAGAPSAREKTLLTIFRNAIAITIITMTVMIILSEIGINIGPLIAGAGVLGLAIGFGAQSLVQDIITGVFIQLENAVNTGDIVTAGGVTGTAEKLTIRSLGIRDLSGTYHMIPFSSIDTVANYMREFAFHVGEYGVAYREDIDEVIIRLREAFAELISDTEQKAKILDELEVHGVTALADSSVNIRVRIKTLPGAQWAVGRAYNRLVKYHLDAAGIEIPFPHVTMYFGQNKDGSAPSAPITLQNPPSANTTHELLPSANAQPNATPKGDFDDED